ncbi:MAG: signal peptidase I [Dehalococcoidia bacterium]|nr:signal peptidase I [Dehalococcoidia bacterium]
MSHLPYVEPDLPDNRYWAAVGLDASAGQSDKPQRRERRFFREVIETVIAAAVLFFIVQAMIQSYQVEGPSMEPNVHNNELLLVNKAVYLTVSRSTVDRFLPFIDLESGGDLYPFHAPRRGEIVVLRGPDGSTHDFIKRIVAGPGDTLEIRRGSLFINRKAVDEPYISQLDLSTTTGPTVMRAGQYYALGDNRPVSLDSRAWGPITEDMIIGKAWFAYWPFEELGFLGHEPLATTASG